MYDGRVVQIGTPQELFERPAHTFVGYFIGSPGMNVIPATISGNKAMVHGAEVTLAQAYKPLDGKVEIGVRPEFLTLTAGDGVPVNVRRVEDVGRHKIVRAELSGQDINILAPEGAEISPDMNRVTLDASKVNVYVNDWLTEGEAA